MDYLPLEPTRLIVGIQDYQNHSVTFSNSIFGTWPAYLDRLAELTAIEFEFQPVGNGRLTQVLAEGSIDLAFPLFQHQSKTNELLMSNPVAFESPGLCYLKSQFDPFTGIVSHWQSKVILVPAHLKPPPLFLENAQNPFPITGEKLRSRALELLRRQRADALFTSGVSSTYFMGSSSYQHIACAPFSGYSVPLYVGANMHLNPRIKAHLTELVSRIPYVSENPH